MATFVVIFLAAASSNMIDPPPGESHFVTHFLMKKLFSATKDVASALEVVIFWRQ